MRLAIYSARGLANPAPAALRRAGTGLPPKTIHCWLPVSRGLELPLRMQRPPAWGQQNTFQRMAKLNG